MQLRRLNEAYEVLAGGDEHLLKSYRNLLKQTRDKNINPETYKFELERFKNEVSRRVDIKVSQGLYEIGSVYEEKIHQELGKRKAASLYK